MDNIIFSLTKVSDALTDKTLYFAHVQTNGTIGRDELAERLAERTKQDVSLWKYFLDALSDEIGIQLLAGFPPFRQIVSGGDEGHLHKMLAHFRSSGAVGAGRLRQPPSGWRRRVSGESR